MPPTNIQLTSIRQTDLDVWTNMQIQSDNIVIYATEAVASRLELSNGR